MRGAERLFLIGLTVCAPHQSPGSSPVFSLAIKWEEARQVFK